MIKYIIHLKLYTIYELCKIKNLKATKILQPKEIIPLFYARVKI